MVVRVQFLGVRGAQNHSPRLVRRFNFGNLFRNFWRGIKPMACARQRKLQKSLAGKTLLFFSCLLHGFSLHRFYGLRYRQPQSHAKFSNLNDVRIREPILVGNPACFDFWCDERKVPTLPQDQHHHVVVDDYQCFFNHRPRTCLDWRASTSCSHEFDRLGRHRSPGFLDHPGLQKSFGNQDVQNKIKVLMRVMQIAIK